MGEFNRLVAVDENNFFPDAVLEKTFASTSSQKFLTKIRGEMTKIQEEIQAGDTRVLNESNAVLAKLDLLTKAFDDYKNEGRGIHKISTPTTMSVDAGIREYYILGDTTINGVKFYKGMALVVRAVDGAFERWIAGVDNFWTPLSSPIPDDRKPAPGAIILTEIGDTFAKYLVVGAVDNVALRANPIDISTDGGSKWATGKPISGTIDGLTMGTSYTLVYRVVDNSGNVSQGEPTTFTTMNEPVWGTAGYDAFRYSDTLIGKKINSSVAWRDSKYPTRALYIAKNIFFVDGGVRGTGSNIFLDVPQNRLDVSFDNQLYGNHASVDVMFGLRGTSSNHPSGAITSWASGFQVRVKIASPSVSLEKFNADGSTSVIATASANANLSSILNSYRYTLDGNIFRLYINGRMILEQTLDYQYQVGDEFGLSMRHSNLMDRVEYMGNFRIRYM